MPPGNQDLSRARPVGPKPPPRLFSLDSGGSLSRLSSRNTSNWNHQASEGNREPEQAERSRTPSGPSVLSGRSAVTTNGDPFNDERGTRWTDDPIVESPQQTPLGDLSFSPPPSSTLSSPPIHKRSFSPRFTHVFRASANSSGEQLSEQSDSAPTRTPSRARWEQLRQHVVPADAPRPASPSSSMQSFDPSALIPATPKPSRLARLGFRHVVDHAREAAIDDSRMFADDILKLCWPSRVPDSARSGKHERENTLGSAASALYIPFVSNSSLTFISTGDAPFTTPSTRMAQDTQRPHSTFSSRQNMSGLLTLHGVILRYASRNSAYLPHENLMLATLLKPFYSDQASQALEDDRWAAVEAFEVAVRTWRAPSPEASIERCIWCCHAASIVSLMRSRILSVLGSLLRPRTGPIEFHSPNAFISLVQALLMALVSIQESQSGSSDADLVAEFIVQMRMRGCGSLAAYLTDVVVDGSAVMLSGVSELELREALVAEAMVRCLEHGPPLFKGQIVDQLIEKYWRRPAQLTAFEPLIALTHTRKLGAFSRAMVTLVSVPGEEAETNVDIVARALESRVDGEVALIGGKRAADVMKTIIRNLLEVLCLDDLSECSTGRLSSVLVRYLADLQWRPVVEKAIQETLKDVEWNIGFRVLQVILSLPEEAHTQLSALIIHCLQERIVLGPPAYPCPPLTSVLEKLSGIYPQAFFKPLFTCAATSKELMVINHLELLSGLSLFMPDFWTRDPEMLLVALMNDVGGQPVTSKVFGKAKLGQTAILVELIACVKSLSSVDPAAPQSGDLLSSATRFFNTLEMRLGVMLEAKEKTTWIPQSQRLLFVVLFTEIRLLTRSLRRSVWLSLSISWLLQSLTGTSVGDGDNNLVGESALNELQETLDQIQALYMSAQESLLATHQRRSTMLFSPADRSFLRGAPDQKSVLVTLFAERAKFLASLSNSFAPKVLRLLVVTSASLSPEDYVQLGPLLWKHCLHAVDPQAASSAAFLIMQCAEKSPTPLIDAAKGDMSSEDEQIRIAAIHRFNILINLRFQLLSQPFLVDRHRRRPFKIARDPLPFVATDIGSSLFVHDEEEEEEEGSMPIELRKRLAEVGWLDEKAPADQKRGWIHTPLSLLPAYAMDRVVGGEGQGSSSPSIQGPSTKPRSNSDISDPGLSRRSSDPASRGVKRRAIFVPSFAALFPNLISLASDSNYAVACTARDSILDAVRADAALFIRPILDLVANNKIEAAVTAIRGMLHLRSVLPPATAHYIFNHLTGYLRYIAREADAREPFHDFALSVALLSNLVTQVSEISIREIRRAKVEVFLMPSGSLWFPNTAPSGPMFPRTSHDKSDDDRLSDLTVITMIRVSQHRLSLSMLKKHPQDVQAVRKNMARLELPSFENTTTTKSLALEDVLPHKDSMWNDLPASHRKLNNLSLLVSRSYLLLVAQIFRSISRHLNDRNELAVFIDGLNRILLAHGDDVGIVGQALIALMVASTRFRRLFTSGGGYPLFMVVIVKTYAEQECHHGIRQAIEYAASRFYALHQEAFLFQTLDVVAHAVTSPDCDSVWMMKHVLQLLSSLRYENLASTPDASGIRHSNKLQEKEALMVTTAEEKPQTFLASIRRKTSEMDERSSLVTDLPEEYETKSLPSEDVVKLLLTVIAHDPSILRAQHFLRLLRLSVSTLYNVSKPARTVLRDGIDAIGAIIIRPTAKSRVSESSSRQNDLTDGEVFSKDATLINSFQAQSKSPSDLTVMRIDFLHLVVEYLRIGGQVQASTSHKFFEITKMLRDSPQEEVAGLLSEYARLFLNKTNRRSGKEAIAFLEIIAPVITAYGSTANFAGVYEAICTVASDDVLARDPRFSAVLVTQVLRAGLEAYMTRCTEGSAPTRSATSSLVSLMARAVYLRNSDIVAEIERHTPSYQFLTGIVLPLALSLSSTGDSGDSWDPKHKEIRRCAWMRLLAYVLSACQASRVSSPERSKSQDKSRTSSSNKAHAMAIVAALQILKVIIVKAEEDLSAALPGIWSRLASVLRSLLSDGDASFVFNNVDFSAPSSPVHSPVHSPHSSIASFEPLGGHDTLRPSVSFDFRRGPLTPANPRIIDYLLWSLLELISLCRGPLTLQLRLLVHEKVHRLAEDIRGQQQGTGLPHLSTGGRRVSSVFSKPRRRPSTVRPAPSPATSSPVLGLSPSFSSPIEGFSHTINIGRRPGFERSPTSSPVGVFGPSGGGGGGLNIIHLGPAHPPASARRAASPDGIVRMVLKDHTIGSPVLARATYRRIRLVQACMGYGVLLPWPGGMVGEEGEGQGEGEGEGQGLDTIKAWTRRHAIEALVKECEELTDEFAETWREAEDDSMVVVNPDESYGSMTF
ncbi:hypothetical protein PAXRUDRAFT_145141 [Paxillus rubicundulus Ve08.2h10]|uniref:Uncharacterized protein n=1 Tax=Paxillus rubicundulus Ve08.2h10 TaxID=930991 RepID=A0A0D0DNH8_9AGAM|nr:hypothetical protein PAXRUDRAFT_145141 [Paxillus rubicundulus Ve08.2h10]